MSNNGLIFKGTRIGVLGGTFDPVHFGHIAAAHAVYRSLNLDSVVFIPAFQPPHKYLYSLSPFLNRSAMLELALDSYPDFHISYMEAERNGPSFTCDTLADIRKKIGAQTQLFFIIGVDAFQEIHTWKKYRQLGDFADFVVLERPPRDKNSIHSYIDDYLGTYLFDPKKNAWSSPTDKGLIYIVSMPPVDISSTEIRERVMRGEALEGLVPEGVGGYIQEEGLYQKG